MENLMTKEEKYNSKDNPTISQYLNNKDLLFINKISDPFTPRHLKCPCNQSQRPLSDVRTTISSPRSSNFKQELV